MSRGLCGLLLLAFAVVALPAPAVAAQSGCLAGTTPLAGWKPNVANCYDRSAEADFKQAYLKFRAAEAQEGAQLVLAANNVEYLVVGKLGGDCNDSDHSAQSKQRAQVVLGQLLPVADTQWKNMSFAIDAMHRAVGFASQNKDVQTRLKTQLGELEKELASLKQIGTFIKTGAGLLQALKCDDATASAELSIQNFTRTDQDARKAHNEISKLLVEFGRAPCKDFAKQGSPMPPAQVSSAAGGGGTQVRTAGNLDVLAPRRLRVLADGTVLPLTLTAHENGFVRIDLTRGSTTLTSVSGLMYKGSAGLRVALPSGASHGTATLRVVFASSSHKASVATLSIQIV